jgi:predicted phosphodiesterase
MRILVVSDTHRKHDNLDIAIERVMPDRIYHLGDGDGRGDVELGVGNDAGQKA